MKCECLVKLNLTNLINCGSLKSLCMCILGTESFVKHQLIWQKLHLFRPLHFEVSIPILAYFQEALV